MELLFVTIIGAALGLAVRYIVPGRDTHGLLVTMVVGAAATAATWVLLLWLGFTFDGGWIWVLSLVIGPLVAAGIAWMLHRRRADADAALLQRLVGAR
ncbi:hypothetical protein OVN18_08645 [Microcella daejeonensis]|uniref:GlsB/YeaQ/YmgE family stress response membrane protein n=1 Tax=Microcella daejeonensis TaxID=2994971 RepID=A0A9E8MJC4_9MICO|nr:hypothetical protein [Microcella daejeonensis]WAB80635.1 hypothetical protein OVN18_08645 [Microcella daejeonensis]